MPTEVRPGGFPKGDLTEEVEFGSSMGEVLPVDEPERGCSIIEAGRYPRDGCSDLEDVIIYFAAPVRAYAKCGRETPKKTAGVGRLVVKRKGRWEEVVGIPMSYYYGGTIKLEMPAL